MRRRRKSYIRSFASGLLLTGLPIAAFFGADYLLAPPTSSTSAVFTRFFQSPPTGTTAIAHSEMPKMAEPRLSPVLHAPTPPVRTSAVRTPANAHGALVTSIQQELQRVGCLSGDVDGNWNDRTQVAMQAFNSSVRVNLPTRQPDYILLTLLQGHSSKACSRARVS